jgi:O-acetyl-ADP-ribose deacetylase
MSQGPEHPSSRMSVQVADITQLEVDAIVNAANERLLPGGGVCGAIHRAAGPELAAACARVGSCATGDAVLTPGFQLKARFVIHAVGPVWQGGAAREEVLLRRCYVRALTLAAQAGATSIAFPAISTGIFGFPQEPAARIAISSVGGYLASAPVPERAIFCCFDESMASIYRGILNTGIVA